MDGVLNINKPSGMTSHDVVQALRRILKEKRIGHTGTLDPLATGVLVLCVGKATRIAQFLEAGDKEYQAVMRLGVTTDTLDSEGTVLETRAFEPPERSRIIEVMDGFVGRIMQQPPAYSALKVGGVPSYKLARQGKAKPLEPRPVTIHGIELTSCENPFVRFTVQCSKGVYVRTLCADIGERLGMGAHLTGLIRTRSGRFDIACALSLDELAGMDLSVVQEQVLIPISEALSDFPKVLVSETESVRVLHGNQVPCPELFSSKSPEMVRLEDASGRLLALARLFSGMLKPEMVFS